MKSCNFQTLNFIITTYFVSECASCFLMMVCISSCMEVASSATWKLSVLSAW